MTFIIETAWLLLMSWHWFGARASATSMRTFGDRYQFEPHQEGCRIMWFMVRVPTILSGLRDRDINIACWPHELWTITIIMPLPIHLHHQLLRWYSYQFWLISQLSGSGIKRGRHDLFNRIHEYIRRMISNAKGVLSLSIDYVWCIRNGIHYRSVACASHGIDKGVRGCPCGTTRLACINKG